MDTNAFINNIVMVSTKTKYTKQLSSARLIYYNREEVLNKERQQNKETTQNNSPPKPTSKEEIAKFY